MTVWPQIADTLGELERRGDESRTDCLRRPRISCPKNLPPLQKLQKMRRPWRFRDSGQLENELGAPITELFASVDESAYAAASIGQVHRARTLDQA